MRGFHHNPADWRLPSSGKLFVLQLVGAFDGNRLQSEFFSLAKHILVGFGIVVGNDAIENGILYSLLYQADFAARLYAESSHNLLAGDRRLETAHAVLLLKFHELLAHKDEVVEETAHLFLVFRGDVGFAERH